MDSKVSKQRRVRWSKEEIEELIGRYENSGQTQVEFSGECGLALSSFQTYLRKYRRVGGAPNQFLSQPYEQLAAVLVNADLRRTHGPRVDGDGGQDTALILLDSAVAARQVKGVSSAKRLTGRSANPGRMALR
jgi:hypothetical protein